MHILGIVTRTHDAGLALLTDGVPTLVLEEERFNREKHTRKFPFFSLDAAFNDNGVNIKNIDVITRPWNMASLRRTMFSAVTGKLPASLNLLGGWLTDTFVWRAVFYINVPIGAIALLLAMGQLARVPTNYSKSDWTGLTLLVLAVGSLQLVLDQGPTRDWFHSNVHRHNCFCGHSLFYARLG